MNKQSITAEAALLRQTLIKLRKDKKIHQSVIAKRLKRHQSYISKYENGEKNLDFIEVIQICHALEVDPFQLLSIYLDGLSKISLIETLYLKNQPSTN